MLLRYAGCVFSAFILSISGVHGQTNRTCALQGSSVDLRCPTKSSTSINRWFTAERTDSGFVQKEISADGRYQMSGENRQTLTISKLQKSDAKVYCCRDNSENPELCWNSSIQLSLADLQVKVTRFMSKQEKHEIELMCSTSCVLTGTPAAYTWYKNGDVLTENKSVWRSDLSGKAATYSCAVKGNNFTAPNVSVDPGNCLTSRCSRCLKVTYAEGEMCRYQNKSMDKTCSIIYPRVPRVKSKDTASVGETVTMTCNIHCHDITNQPTTYTWYFNNIAMKPSQNQATLDIKIQTSDQSGSYSCAVTVGEFSISSTEHNLTVISFTTIHITAAATGAGAALLVTIPIIFFIWMRTKRTWGQSTDEEPYNEEQLSSTHLYENIPAQPPEQDELYYTTVNIEPTAQQHQPRQHDHVAYSVVSLRP